ncbi:MBL fold metallo-hydrolase [Synechococcus sp. BS56D]|uniref:MBL fold metallo-hydrolase n=1 Tax=Synechococcus sp. BS56D TaxID=2055944 RepID=UPI00103875B0|nr:MBL fold metallo-hydrolase [Synechococcus sp. BS56D]TCD56749.1 MBL fold metallo-hydrolase [Synechococcus sp. BS56D]
MSDQATYFGANGWLLEISGLRVLVDPWLKGDLVFPPGPWLLKGELPQEITVPERLDLLLLTQGLADHAHPDTLQWLPKTLPVVASPAAARVAQRLGFSSITSLRPGEHTRVGELTVQATAGAAVPTVENGYLLDWPEGSLYLEPHGVLDPKLPKRSIDTVITPVVDLGLPLLGDFITGAKVLPELMQRFQPERVLASTTGGDVRFSGLISSLLQGGEGPREVPEGSETYPVVVPTPGIAIPLTRSAAEQSAPE